MIARAPRAVGIATAVGLALRLIVALALPVAPAWDGVIFERAARQLAAGQGYSQRIFDPAWWDLPTAFYAPGWPAALAAWSWLGLPGSGDLVLQALLGALAIPLIAWLGHRAGASARSIVIAAWLTALWPSGVLGAASWLTEPLFTALFLLALVPLARPSRASASEDFVDLPSRLPAFSSSGSVREHRTSRADERGGPQTLVGSRPSSGSVRKQTTSRPDVGSSSSERRKGWKTGREDRGSLRASPASSAGFGSRTVLAAALVSGALFGLAAYVRPTGLLLAPAALFAFGWFHVRGASRLRRVLLALALAVIGTIAALAPLAPWVARNAIRMNTAVLTTSTGANLHIGTHGALFARVPDRFDCAAGPPERVRDRCHRERALARIAGDPLRWLALGAAKLAHTFGYDASAALHLGAGLGDPDPARRPGWLALALLGSIHWWVLLLAALSRRPRGFAWIVLATLAALALTHFVFFGGDRYHQPLTPLLALLAAPRLAAWLDRARGI